MFPTVHGVAASDTTEAFPHAVDAFKAKGSRNYLLAWAPLNPTFPCSAESFPAQLSELNLGSPSWHADWERGNTGVLRRCSRGDGRWQQPRRQYVSQETREPHSPRRATLNSPKESRGPSSFVSVTFQWQRGASLGRGAVGAPLRDELGPAAIQTEPTNKGSAAGGAGHLPGQVPDLRLSLAPPPSRPGVSLSWPLAPRPAPGCAGPSPRATRSAPDCGWAGAGCLRTARAGLQAPFGEQGFPRAKGVKLSRPLQVSFYPAAEPTAEGALPMRVGRDPRGPAGAAD